MMRGVKSTHHTAQLCRLYQTIPTIWKYALLVITHKLSKGRYTIIHQHKLHIMHIEVLRTYIYHLLDSLCLPKQGKKIGKFSEIFSTAPILDGPYFDGPYFRRPLFRRPLFQMALILVGPYLDKKIKISQIRAD